MTYPATPADWLLAEYDAIDIDELIERLEASHGGRYSR